MSASLSVDVADVVVESVVTVRAVTVVVMPEKERRVLHLESLLLNCELCYTFLTVTIIDTNFSRGGFGRGAGRGGAPPAS